MNRLKAYVPYSVVLPTYNRPTLLRSALLGLVNQTLPPDSYEIIVVDDGSKDYSAKIVTQEIIQQYPSHHIYYLHKKNGGHASARNLGIIHAVGKIIFTTDDDCEVPDTWLEQLLAGFDMFPKAMAVGGTYNAPPEEIRTNKIAAFYDYAFYRGRKPNGNLVFSNYPWGHNRCGNSANIAYRKELFDQMGFFDERINFSGNVDWEFRTRCLTFGHGFLYVPLEVLHHRKFNLRKFFYKSFLQGRGFDYMNHKFPHQISNLGRTRALTLNKIICAHLERRSDIIAYKFLSLFLLRDLAQLCGKWANRIYFFTPVKKYSRVPQIDRYYFEFDKQTLETLTAVTVKKYTPPDNPLPVDTTNILFSIIIPTHNRVRGLLKTIHSCLQQDIPKTLFEIIVVDDGSNDNTPTILKEYIEKEKLDNLIIISQKNAGPAAARNHGAMIARGDYLFFIDDDCIAPPDWIRKKFNIFIEHPDISAVGGWHLTPWHIATKYSKYFNNILHRVTYPHNPYTEQIITDSPFYHRFTNTANFAIRKNIFLAVGKFDSIYAFAFEDVEFGVRLTDQNYKICYIPEPVVHTKNLDLRGFVASIAVRAEGLLFYYQNVSFIPYTSNTYPALLTKVYTLFISFLQRKYSTQVELFRELLIAIFLRESMKDTDTKKIRSKILFDFEYKRKKYRDRT